jgi:5-methylcytosine-specific restriction endonuclease McrA
MTNRYGLLGLIGQTEDERRKTIAWNNALAVENSPHRLDCDRRVICWEEYGETTARGWEIDHATPTALGGPDSYSNLRARHWQGNRSDGGLLGGLSKLGKASGLLGGLFGNSS